MNKPYIVCHMMMSVDGRIDCGMTVKIPGSESYYKTLDALEVPTTLSGRVTAELEMANPGEFEPKADPVPIGKVAFSKKKDATGYSVIVDSKGKLLWPDDHASSTPLIVATSEKASQEYLAYLDELGISWIACGKKRVDLKKLCEILHNHFGVERMAVVGGGTINGAFLDAGLLDEVSILLGPGIDGRAGMGATFDGLPMDHEPVSLRLKGVRTFEDGSVWIRYDA